MHKKLIAHGAVCTGSALKAYCTRSILHKGCTKSNLHKEPFALKVVPTKSILDLNTVHIFYYLTFKSLAKCNIHHHIIRIGGVNELFMQIVFFFGQSSD